MKKSWTNGLEPDVEKEIRMAFTSSLLLRKRLTEMLNKKELENYRTNISKADYECPNWALKKADAVGYARALKDILELIE